MIKNDKKWEIILPLLPAALLGGRPRKTSLRKVINAIFYITRSGCAWRLLPHEFPAWSTVYGYYHRWTTNQTWQRIYDTLRARVRQKEGRHKHPTAGSIDSQSVKTTALSGIKGYDSGKQISRAQTTHFGRYSWVDFSRCCHRGFCSRA